MSKKVMSDDAVRANIEGRVFSREMVGEFLKNDLERVFSLAEILLTDEKCFGVVADALYTRYLELKTPDPDQLELDGLQTKSE